MFQFIPPLKNVEILSDESLRVIFALDEEEILPDDSEIAEEFESYLGCKFKEVNWSRKITYNKETVNTVTLTAVKERPVGWLRLVLDWDDGRNSSTYECELVKAKNFLHFPAFWGKDKNKILVWLELF